MDACETINEYKKHCENLGLVSLNMMKYVIHHNVQFHDKLKNCLTPVCEHITPKNVSM